MGRCWRCGGENQGVPALIWFLIALGWSGWSRLLAALSIYLSIFPFLPPPDCPGCYKPSKVNQEIVDFAVSELQGGEQGGKCVGGVLGVENFQSQVGLELRAGFD